MRLVRYTVRSVTTSYATVVVVWGILSSHGRVLNAAEEAGGISPMLPLSVEMSLPYDGTKLSNYRRLGGGG